MNPAGAAVGRDVRIRPIATFAATDRYFRSLGRNFSILVAMMIIRGVCPIGLVEVLFAMTSKRFIGALRVIAKHSRSRCIPRRNQFTCTGFLRIIAWFARSIGTNAEIIAVSAFITVSGAALAAGFSPLNNDLVVLSPQDFKLLNRITWGVNSSSAHEFARLGADAFIEKQLHPAIADPLPAQAQTQIDTLTDSKKSIETLVMELGQQAKSANAIADAELKQAAQKVFQDNLNRLGREAAARSLLRDLYSPAQLREQLVWFWFNHFNVHLYKSNIRMLIGDYQDNAIRPHALGRFRDLLSATLHHAAMLRYLDNDQNAVDHINENYAREIMELHTMGVGSGYTQNDVQELARILTGVGVNQTSNAPQIKPELQGAYVRQGLFEFNPNRHDFGDKYLLGHLIKGRGLAEVDEALDLLSRAPATPHFISSKLATFFVSDNPPPALIDRMATTFRQTDGNIAVVLKTMFASPEFKASLGAQFKDPMHYVLSAVRLAYDDKIVLNTAPILGWLGRLAEPLYGHETPDGYPLGEGSWIGPGQMSMRFEIARAIGSGSAGLFKPDGPDSVDHSAFPQLANALYFTIERQMLSTSTRQALDQAISLQDWNTLFLASPEFMRR
jgi:uncharacterized protein (DUF1800 family)